MTESITAGPPMTFGATRPQINRATKNGKTRLCSLVEKHPSPSKEIVFWCRSPEVKKKMTLRDSTGRLLGAVPKGNGAS